LFNVAESLGGTHPLSLQKFVVKLLCKYEGNIRVEVKSFSEICHSTGEVYGVSEMHRWKECVIELPFNRFVNKGGKFSRLFPIR
jgi:hypothetical protein